MLKTLKISQREKKKKISKDTGEKIVNKDFKFKVPVRLPGRNTGWVGIYEPKIPGKGYA